MSKSGKGSADGWHGSGIGVAGMRASMYGEMAASASGDRPGLETSTEWDAALAGAIHFLDTTGLTDRATRALLAEAAATWMAGDLAELDSSAAEVCRRLAHEFRYRVRTR